VSNAQLIIVAGRNAALQQQLATTIWEIPTQVCGFATNMPELMGASDVLVTKAGPGTLGEAFIAGLPVIISGFIPDQAGAYAPDPTKIVSLLRKWLQPDDDTLKQMTTNAAALARPEAAATIAQRLHRLLITEHASRPLSARVDTSFDPSRTASCAATCQKEPEKRGESWQTHCP
jgi:1,2-diacylglycerol 3-beta-galactosyltransferase